MEFVVLLVCLLLAALFDHVMISTPIVKKNEFAYTRLLSASQIDTFERDLRLIQSFGNECVAREPDLSVEQQEQVLERCLSSPQVVDIKKQFRMWSQNMKEYDQIRNYLVYTA